MYTGIVLEAMFKLAFFSRIIYQQNTGHLQLEWEALWNHYWEYQRRYRW